MLVAVERGGPVRAVRVESDRIEHLSPQISNFVEKDAHLMTDELHSYVSIGRNYASHETVNHGQKEFTRGDVHNNTAESFAAIIERAKQGVFHYLSPKHLNRYLHEFGFRWNHRVPELKVNRQGKKKIIMKPMSVSKMMLSVLSNAAGRQLRRSTSGGILCPVNQELY